MRLYQTKMLLHNKGTHQQNEETTYWLENNIGKSYFWQGVKYELLKNKIKKEREKFIQYNSRKQTTWF